MPKDTELKWVVISDFSPGIQQRVNFQGSTLAPAKPGAATINTFRCIALPNGGLGPLPKRFFDFNADIPAGTLDGIQVGAFNTTAPINGDSDNGPDAAEAHIISSYILPADNPTGLFIDWDRYKLYSAGVPKENIRSVHSSINTSGSTSTASFSANVYPFRANPTDVTKPGIPGMVGSWATSSDVANSFWKMFPNPTTPSVTSTGEISSANNYNSYTAHQGRAIGFQPIAWGHGTNANWTANEQMTYTSSNSLVLDPSLAGSQVVFGDENSTGYVAAASMNASELLLLKLDGGGYLFRGDINSPTVIHLPGIVSPGSLNFQIPISTSIGLIYLVAGAGAWLWNGGETSTQISSQLEGNFWQINTNTTLRLAYWKGWVLLPNNFLYDPRINSWWRIEDPDDFVVSSWSTSSSEFDGILYGCRSYATAADPHLFSGWVMRAPATSYQWESQPIPETMFQQSKLREITLVAQGSGTITITATADDGHDPDGVSTTLTFTLGDYNRPQALRQNISLTGTHMQIKILADNSTNNAGAPIIYSVGLGLTSIQHTAISQ